METGWESLLFKERGRRMRVLRNFMGLGERVGGLGLRGWTEQKEFVLFNGCFMFWGQRAGSISQEFRETAHVL